MPVLERSELEASPLADLHAIADQLGIDGFKRLRKADLIDKILAVQGGGPPPAASEGGDGSAAAGEADTDGEQAPKRTRKRRLIRPRRGAKRDEEEHEQPEQQVSEPEPEPAAVRGGKRSPQPDAGEREPVGGEREPARERPRRGRSAGEERIAEGVVEVLANGSAFLRVNPPEQSPDDLYISSAQVRRCELVDGDRVSGPARPPRRSERYASLSRIDSINGAPADEVAAGTRYEDLPADWPAERLAFVAGDPTLEAIEWLTPLGRGSRAVIAGGRFAGKSEILRRIAGALQDQPQLTLSVVLVGVRPEEVTQWQEGPLAPAVALSFAASPDSQAQALERALETARRTAARGGDAVVLLDTLDGLPPHAA
ncbi:MAG TPA: Rho termination factor N-terminal domain-containing protein, partial [Solirubrobacteraceae bacterium]|nr:Rho termination factor N-terminal domain-containing protein [Solirubrobacteraceae bacterium]